MRVKEKEKRITIERDWSAWMTGWPEEWVSRGNKSWRVFETVQRDFEGWRWERCTWRFWCNCSEREGREMRWKKREEKRATAPEPVRREEWKVKCIENNLRHNWIWHWRVDRWLWFFSPFLGKNSEQRAQRVSEWVKKSHSQLMKNCCLVICVPLHWMRAVRVKKRREKYIWCPHQCCYSLCLNMCQCQRALQ